MDIEDVKSWLVVAERDLRAARNCLFGPEPTTEAAAYHCQQAAEKLAKAALVSLNSHVPFSHDVRVLLGLLPDAYPLKPQFMPLARFTPYATVYRYPVDDPLGIPPAPSVSDVEAWLAEIAAVKKALEALVGA